MTTRHTTVIEQSPRDHTVVGVSFTSWPHVRLGDHAVKIGSGITPLGGHASYRRTGIPLIRSQNVLMNSFETRGLAFISEEQNAEMAGSRVQPGDVLLNITGASIGRVCVVPAVLCPANVNQHVCIIRTDGSIVPEFLAYYLATSKFQSIIGDSQAGATRQALTKTLIEAFDIPSLPVGDQRRIAARLREELAEVERARAAVIEQRNSARLLPARLLRRVFQSPKAKAWPFRRLGDVASLLPSKSISLAGDTTVNAVTTACLTETAFRVDGIKLARMWARDAAECGVKKDEILVARSNTPELVGRASVYPGDPPSLVASDLTIRIWAGPDVWPGFLCRFLSFLFVAGHWQERAGGTSGSMKKITRSQIENLPVPVPPLEVQRATAESLANELSEAERLTTVLNWRLKLIEDLPPRILSAAFGDAQNRTSDNGEGIDDHKKR